VTLERLLARAPRFFNYRLKTDPFRLFVLELLMYNRVDRTKEKRRVIDLERSGLNCVPITKGKLDRILY
jgi:hypothetical protein